MHHNCNTTLTNPKSLIPLNVLFFRNVRPYGYSRIGSKTLDSMLSKSNFLFLYYNLYKVYERRFRSVVALLHSDEGNHLVELQRETRFRCLFQKLEHFPLAEHNMLLLLLLIHLYYCYYLFYCDFLVNNLIHFFHYFDPSLENFSVFLYIQTLVAFLKFKKSLE